MIDPEGSLRHILRHETADLHEAVDADLSQYDLASRDGYMLFLQRQGAVLFSAEAALVEQKAFHSIPYAAERLRGEVLSRDMNALGATMRKGPPMSFLNALGATVGVSYVLEGSRLGAKILLKRVAPEFRATEFLRHGDSLPLWPTYLNWLRAQMLDRGETLRAIEAARAVFRAYLAT